MSLTERETHFEFGENWKNYSKTIDQKRIDSAVVGVKKLFPHGLAGKTFLDIGCGSGLHTLAALLLGAASVTAVDIDENSVSTTQALLTKHAPNPNWTAKIASIFDASPDMLGKFDVVYSWGVLHHTGDMWGAIERAADLVKPGGQFAIAIYSTTSCDSMWKAEKKFYSRAPRPVQWSIRQVYMAAFLAAKTLLGGNPISYVRHYSEVRGMNFSHDAHDWLGGYPYETGTPEELLERVSALGFKEVRSFRLPATTGLFGAGCNEFVFAKLL
ncbi:bifunctional 2-polyprenyl-6-hydroxyphenol methylase/3-demethylubiquinol 3-O-methyltransferase UbiG [Bradyrhizobium sp. URHD0069]|uniref:class I SAM-dependent methyltransferase n=1 Tax=Bradyrhizobium sp. URHD0069 TaxID=1380355 RepID=UPI0004971107|nr:class I SAM-dependent methyltransferase [Bradyrhizobium sp. URHD0069]